MPRAQIRFAVFKPRPKDPGFRQQIGPHARLFRHVYGNDLDWREGKYCPEHGRMTHHYTFKEAKAYRQRCPGCGTKLEDYWPESVVARRIEIQLGLADAVCILAARNTRLVGMAIAFSAIPEELDDRLNWGNDNQPLPGDQRVDFLDNLYRHCPVPPPLPNGESGPNGDRRVAYAAEMCVDQSARGRGIGGTLFDMRALALQARGLKTMVMRTRPGAKTFEWHHKRGGIPIVGEYPDPDERVIIAGPISRYNQRELVLR